jgi:hypothetical protein
MLTRIVVVTVLALGGMSTLSTGTRVAWANDCEPSSGGFSSDGYWVCTSTGSASGDLGGSVGGVTGDGVPVGDDSGSGASAGGDGSDSASPPCTYLDFDPNRGTQPPPGHGAEPGHWVFIYCGDDRSSAGWEWLADGATTPVVVRWPSPAELAVQAFRSMTLPAPVVEYNPRRRPGHVDGTVVGVDTWLWVDASALAGRSVSVSAGPNSATVAARPMSVAFDSGDGGAPVACPDGGIAYDPAHPDATSSCIYRYLKSSAMAPGQAFTVTATVAWGATWRGSDGSGGELPVLSVTGSLPVRVDEIQAVNF